MKIFSRIFNLWVGLAIVFQLVIACSTGIEGTRAIKMSRAERRDSRPSDEEVFASRIVSQPISEWSQDKMFLVADSKAKLIYEFPSIASDDSVVGKTLYYEGYELRPTPGGKNSLALRFNDGFDKVYYPTSKQSAEDLKAFTGLDLPMLIDLDLVNMADSLLSGRKFWLLSSLWYDKEENPENGRKFVPVSVTQVRSGNAVFPLKVDFITDRGDSASLFLNVKAQSGLGAESRTFPSLFSLTDPRLRYPGISDQVWDLITRGKVDIGMTKEECKLSLGSPSDVNTGHTWGNLVDIWGYKDGAVLYFEDGRLSNFRR